MATPSPATAHPRRSLDGVRCTGIEAHDLPSGRSVYIYALEITLRSGAVILAKRRYSAWRDLHTEVRDLHTFGSGPDRPLPPFPDKASFSRQTPSFLAARAKALARYVCCLFPAALCARGCSPVYPGCEPMHPRYVAAVLADPVLAGLPAVVALYSGGGGPGFAPGSLDSAFDSALDSTPGSAASTPAARQYQHTPIQSALLPGATPPARSLAAPPATPPAPPQPAAAAAAKVAPAPLPAPLAPLPGSAASGASELLMPLLALLLSLLAGATLAAPVVAAASCLVGIGTGRLCRLRLAPRSPHSAPPPSLLAGGGEADGGELDGGGAGGVGGPAYVYTGHGGRRLSDSEPAAAAPGAARGAAHGAWPAPPASEMAARGAGASEGGQLRAGSPGLYPDPHAHTQPQPSPHARQLGNLSREMAAFAAPSIAARAAAGATPPAAAGGAAASPLEAEAVAEAKEAMRLLIDTLAQAAPAKAARGATLANGWKHHSSRQEVDILVNYSGALGPGVTAVMGLGELEAPVGVAYLAMEDDRVRGKHLDRQWISTEVVAALPARLCESALGGGWEVLECSVVDTLYRSPAWPVANRQTVCARLVARHAATGRLRVALRSVRTPRPLPAGFVRGTVAAAGYELRPAQSSSGGDACSMVYANALDPNGSLPQSVVSVTVADRAMIVGRLRRLLQAEPAAWADPFAPAGLPAGRASPVQSA